MIDKNTVVHLGLEKLMLSNPINKTKAYIDKKLLAQLILSNNISIELKDKLRKLGFIDNEVDEKTHADIQHWYKRNWTNSLNYYLWSYTSHLFDQGEDYEKKQSKVITEYIDTDGLPVAPRTATKKAVSLGELADLPNKSLGDVLWEREAVLATPKRSMKLKELSSILWYGMQDFRSYRNLEIDDNPLNGVNSFGVAFDIYICIYSVHSISPGIYFYDSLKHTLDLINPIDLNTLHNKMYKLQFDQKVAHTASFAAVLVSHFERYQWRYRHEAALKQIYINAGQIIHPLMLLSTLYIQYALTKNYTNPDCTRD